MYWSSLPWDKALQEQRRPITSTWWEDPEWIMYYIHAACPHGLQNVVLSPRRNFTPLRKKFVLNMYNLLLTVLSLYWAQSLYDLIFEQAFMYKSAWHKLHLSLTWQNPITHDHYALLTVSDAMPNETGLSHVSQATCVPAIKLATCEVTLKHWGRR
jgi:hypothetical protein